MPTPVADPASVGMSIVLVVAGTGAFFVIVGIAGLSASIAGTLLFGAGNVLVWRLRSRGGGE